MKPDNETSKIKWIESDTLMFKLIRNFVNLLHVLMNIKKKSLMIKLNKKFEGKNNNLKTSGFLWCKVSKVSLQSL